MSIRQRVLPPGWYPASAYETKETIEQFASEFHKINPRALAAVAPHAGWAFSGSIACEAVCNLQPDLETIIVIGGHLPPIDTVMAFSEDEYSTPLGPLKADTEFLAELKKEMLVKDDRHADNTVEIQLPLIKHFYPEALVLGLRVSPSKISVELGHKIFEIAANLKRKVRVLGSTDLTHYGSNYDFVPKGSGRTAVHWVKEVNDKHFIDALLRMKADEAINLALKENSACSAGGAVAALSYARASGGKHGKLIKYATSWDVHPSESFVGYVGISFY
ncbi:MAG: AmmeMemoRadiSam system protein B [Spirochaetales bacterium]|nr:AmmeMemoRadiSam system protein B [Spirochaetales bacterium]